MSARKWLKLNTHEAENLQCQQINTAEQAAARYEARCLVTSRTNRKNPSQPQP